MKAERRRARVTVSDEEYVDEGPRGGVMDGGSQEGANALRVQLVDLRRGMSG